MEPADIPRDVLRDVPRDVLRDVPRDVLRDVPPPHRGLASAPASRASGMVIVAAAVIVIGGLKAAASICLPVAVAIFLAFVLAPAVAGLERLRVPRLAAVGLVTLLSFGLMGGLGWVVFHQVGTLLEDRALYSRQLHEKIQSMLVGVKESQSKVGKVIETVKDAIDEPPPGEEAPAASPRSPASSRDLPILVRVVEGPPSMLRQLQVAIGAFLDPLGQAGIVTILVIYLLVRREDIRDRIIRISSHQGFGGTTILFGDAARGLSRYLGALALINAGYGIGASAGLFLLDTPGWALWGALCGTFRFIPYIGVPLGAVPPLLLLAITTEGWSAVLLGAAIFVVLELIIYVGVEPWLSGRSTGLSPIAILLAAIFWTWLWGPMGLVVATPLTLCLMLLGREVPRLGALRILLGTEDPLKPHERLYDRLLANEPAQAMAVVESFSAERPLAEVHDVVAVPALELLQEDWRSGRITAQRRELVMDELEELVSSTPAGEDSEGIAASDAPGASGSAVAASAAVACMAAEPGEGEIASRPLASGLRAGGYRAEALPAGLLLGEAAALIERLGAEAVCVVGLPGEIARTTGVARRLLALAPRRALIALLWGSTDEQARVARRILKGGPAHVILDSRRLPATLRELSIQPERPAELVAP